MPKVIVRIKGGIGNQLFCYAAARRLAIVNNAELVIDDVSGFVRDHAYKRRYMLDYFQISARKATAAERLEPFERFRRGMMKWLSRRKPFIERQYLEQEGPDFDSRLLNLKVKNTLFLDGYWQSERYFQDVEQLIRQDLQIIPPVDEINQNMGRDIRGRTAVAVHVRWFSRLENAVLHNASVDYYQEAINLLEKKIESPYYYLFSDDPVAAREKLALPRHRTTVVSHNRGDSNAISDLWLMTQCQHHIIANSTFSWWGAWLSSAAEKIVIAPAMRSSDISAWNFEGLVPSQWIQLVPY